MKEPLKQERLTLPWNCFIDFAIEHWFGCHATEPGLAGDIDAIESWLIDWLQPRFYLFVGGLNCKVPL